jgi:hypothetical protein
VFESRRGHWGLVVFGLGMEGPMIWVIFAAAVLAVIVTAAILFRAAPADDQREVDGVVGHDCPMCTSEDAEESVGGAWRCRKCGYESTWESRPGLSVKIRRLQDLNRAYTCYERAADKLLSVTGALGVLHGPPPGAMANQEAMEEARREMDDGLQLLRGLGRAHPDLFAAVPDPAAPAAAGPLVDLAVGGRIGSLLDQGEIQRTLDDLAGFSGRLLEATRRAREDVRRSVDAQAPSA